MSLVSHPFPGTNYKRFHFPKLMYILFLHKIFRLLLFQYVPIMIFFGVIFKFTLFSHLLMSESLRSHRLQYPKLPYSSPFSRACSNWVGDAIQPSHPLSSPSPPAFNLCQHQGLFKWVISSYQVAKVLEFQHQHQSFQWTPRTDLL